MSVKTEIDALQQKAREEIKQQAIKAAQERIDKCEKSNYRLFANDDLIPLIWWDEPQPRPWEAGWCWPASDAYVTSQYFDKHIKENRPPIVILFPSRRKSDEDGVVDFCVDSPIYGYMTDSSFGFYEVSVPKKRVNGEPIAIEVDYSLRLNGIWHSYIWNGKIDIDIGDYRAGDDPWLEECRDSIRYNEDYDDEDYDDEDED